MNEPLKETGCFMQLCFVLQKIRMSFFALILSPFISGSHVFLVEIWTIESKDSSWNLSVRICFCEKSMSVFESSDLVYFV